MNRSERRRQEKRNLSEIQKGLDPVDVRQDLVVTLIRQTFKHLEVAKKRKSIDSLMSFIFNNVDKSGLRLSDVQVSCDKECWYCCTNWVASTVPEAVFFVKKIQVQSLPSFQDKLNDAMNVVDGVGFEKRGKMIVNCPALVGKLCGNYEHRPVVCRTASSFDADICKRSYTENSGENIPISGAHLRNRGLYSQILACASMHAGLAYESYEFCSALDVVNKSADIEARWLNGEDVFAGLPLDPMPSEVTFQLQTLRSMAFG